MSGGEWEWVGVGRWVEVCGGEWVGVGGGEKASGWVLERWVGC